MTNEERNKEASRNFPGYDNKEKYYAWCNKYGKLNSHPYCFE